MENRNTGFLVETRVEDFVFGAATKIAHEDRNSTGDWAVFLPTGEKQSGRFFDTMGCVTFSAMNSLECQIRWMLGNKLVPAATLKFLRDNGYLDDQDSPNFSDRFTVKMSGTTPDGNSMQAVWDSVRKHGLVPEKAWPNELQYFDRATYFREPPQEVKDLGKQFLVHFKAEYEWIQSKSQIAKALKHAPVHIATAVCAGWATDRIVNTCGLPVAHATMIYATTPEGFRDFDSYEPFAKILAPNYNIPFMLKGVLTPLLKDDGTPNPENKPVTFDRDLVAGETSIDVKHLQDRLAVIDPPTGFYGSQTVAAVRRYMVYNNIGSWWEKNVYPAGRRVGPKIRAFLNSH